MAQVEDGSEDVRVITRLEAQPCVKLSVLKQADANTVEVAKGGQQKIEDLEKALPAGVRLGMVENQADYVEAALAGVRNAAIEGAFLVILVSYVFLGSWRQTFVMAMALPVTLLGQLWSHEAGGLFSEYFFVGRACRCHSVST